MYYFYLFSQIYIYADFNIFLSSCLIFISKKIIFCNNYGSFIFFHINNKNENIISLNIYIYTRRYNYNKNVFFEIDQIC